MNTILSKFISILLLTKAFCLVDLQSQFLPSFAIAGGPRFGWNFNLTKDLNSELKKGNFPEVSEKGFFQMGGGGFLDLPSGKNYIRISGFGNGFSTNLTVKINDSLTKATNYSMGEGGIAVEYIIPLSKFIDISFGSSVSTGRLKIELYNYGSGSLNWDDVFGELTSNSSSGNISRIFRSRFYSVSPQAGIGLMLRKFLYLKIDFGYQYSLHNAWFVDNDLEVKSFPSKIRASGAFINAGLNFGLFIR